MIHIDEALQLSPIKDFCIDLIKILHNQEISPEKLAKLVGLGHHENIKIEIFDNRIYPSNIRICPSGKIRVVVEKGQGGEYIVKLIFPKDHSFFGRKDEYMQEREAMENSAQLFQNGGMPNIIAR